MTIPKILAAALILASSLAAAGAQDAAPQTAASPGVATGPAAQSAEIDALANCFVTHSGPKEADGIKKMMIAALSDDIPGLKSAVAEFSGLLLNLSMNSCAVGLNKIQDPAYRPIFQAASQKYGEVLGQKLMQEAFAKLN